MEFEKPTFSPSISFSLFSRINSLFEPDKSQWGNLFNGSTISSETPLNVQQEQTRMLETIIDLCTKSQKRFRKMPEKLVCVNDEIPSSRLSAVVTTLVNSDHFPMILIKVKTVMSSNSQQEPPKNTIFQFRLEYYKENDNQDYKIRIMPVDLSGAFFFGTGYIDVDYFLEKLTQLFKQGLTLSSGSGNLYYERCVTVADF